MKIADNILKECLKQAYFINGTAYAGKSTMVRLLAEKHDMIFCGENYHMALAERAATVEAQPNYSYFKTMKSWQEFVNRTPEEYARWIDGGAEEAAQFEVAELLRLSAAGKKIIVDTNLSPQQLRQLSDYHRVAFLLSPQSMAVERFFQRDDPEKQFLLRQIEAAENPEKTMENYRACIARINRPAVYDRFKNSGFFVIERQAGDGDTRAAVLAQLEAHFGL